MVIQRSDRVSEVLSRDERLLDAFIRASPVFQRLRSPMMRRTMGRLATVEQAARVAGIDADLLIEQLNRAITPDAEPPADAPRESTSPDEKSLNPTRPMAETDTSPPPALLAIPADRVVDLDVREELREGKEPFSRIMAARREVPEGGMLRLRAIFEPVPLYVVMAKQGFDRWTEKLAEDDWRVWFYPAGTDTEAGASPAATGFRPEAPAAEDEGEDVIVLDVRGLDPPEPMVRTLAELDRLPPGRTLLQINERVPQFLLPRLEELGFTHQIREQHEGLVRIFIRRRDEP